MSASDALGLSSFQAASAVGTCWLDLHGVRVAVSHSDGVAKVYREGRVVARVTAAEVGVSTGAALCRGDFVNRLRRIVDLAAERVPWAPGAALPITMGGGAS